MSLQGESGRSSPEPLLTRGSVPTLQPQGSGSVLGRGRPYHLVALLSSSCPGPAGWWTDGEPSLLSEVGFFFLT